MTAHPSSLELDELALGAADPASQRRIQDHLAGCERCRAEAEAAGADRETFRRELLPRSLDAVVGRARPTWLRRARRAWLLIPVAAAAAALLWFIRLAPVGLTGRVEPSAGPTLAVKGAAALQVFASRDGSVFAVRDGAALRAGDQIRFAVQPAGLPYVLIASIDGAGQATVYFPPAASRSGAVDPAARAELPGSIELDAAPGPERIYALFTRAPLEAEPVLAALRAVGSGGAGAIRGRRSLDVAADDQVSLVFEKERP